MAAPAPAEFGFVDPPPDAGLFFPIEWWIPIAYVILAGLLLWRFARMMNPARAAIYACVGAWLGSLIPAALIFVGLQYGQMGGGVPMLLLVSAVTLVVGGLCALRLKSGTGDE
jgi:hypothetical protein